MYPIEIEIENVFNCLFQGFQLKYDGNVADKANQDVALVARLKVKLF